MHFLTCTHNRICGEDPGADDDFCGPRKTWGSHHFETDVAMHLFERGPSEVWLWSILSSGGDSSFSRKGHGPIDLPCSFRGFAIFNHTQDKAKPHMGPKKNKPKAASATGSRTPPKPSGHLSESCARSGPIDPGSLEQPATRKSDFPSPRGSPKKKSWTVSWEKKEERRKEEGRKKRHGLRAAARAPGPAAGSSMDPPDTSGEGVPSILFWAWGNWKPKTFLVRRLLLFFATLYSHMNCLSLTSAIAFSLAQTEAPDLRRSSAFAAVSTSLLWALPQRQRKKQRPRPLPTLREISAKVALCSQNEASNPRKASNPNSSPPRPPASPAQRPIRRRRPGPRPQQLYREAQVLGGRLAWEA